MCQICHISDDNWDTIQHNTASVELHPMYVFDMVIAKAKEKMDSLTMTLVYCIWSYKLLTKT